MRLKLQPNEEHSYRSLPPAAKVITCRLLMLHKPQAPRLPYAGTTHVSTRTLQTLLSEGELFVHIQSPASPDIAPDFKSISLSLSLIHLANYRKVHSAIMGTRGVLGHIIRSKNIRKATYNHFDSYPSGMGVQLAKFINSLTDEQIEKMIKMMGKIEW